MTTPTTNTTTYAWVVIEDNAGQVYLIVWDAKQDIVYIGLKYAETEDLLEDITLLYDSPNFGLWPNNWMDTTNDTTPDTLYREIRKYIRAGVYRTIADCIYIYPGRMGPAGLRNFKLQQYSSDWYISTTLPCSNIQFLKKLNSGDMSHVELQCYQDTITY